MTRARNPILLCSLLFALIAVTSCASIRGDRVETGFGPANDRASEPSTVDLSRPEAVRVELAPKVQLESAASPIASAAEQMGTVLPVVAQAQPGPDPVGLGQQDATASFDFQARELYSGSTVDGVDLFGQGKVLVTFVQPGCDISVDDGPTIAEIAEQHPEAIFVIVHSGADDVAYQAFAEEAMLFQENMMHLSDTNGSLAARYSIDAYPTTLLIDSDMRITAVTGAMDRESQRAAVESVTTRSIAT